jgi:putative chitinase
VNTINWRAAQIELGVIPDGIAGPNTFAALLRRMAVAAGAQPDQAILNSLAIACVVHFPTYGIADSATRLADFLAQTANETGGYKVYAENLNYSAEALVRTWPNRFTASSAPSFARQPQLIANKVYGGRMGNVLPNDGWDYRGRGMLQLTGRANYEGANKRLGIGLDTNPDIASVPALSLLLACDFYRQNGVLDAIDRGDTDGARKITNGGSIGLDNVNKLRAVAMEILA